VGHQFRFYNGLFGAENQMGHTAILYLPVTMIHAKGLKKARFDSPLGHIAKLSSALSEGV